MRRYNKTISRINTEPYLGLDGINSSPYREVRKKLDFEQDNIVEGDRIMQDREYEMTKTISYSSSDSLSESSPDSSSESSLEGLSSIDKFEYEVASMRSMMHNHSLESAMNDDKLSKSDIFIKSKIRQMGISDLLYGRNIRSLKLLIRYFINIREVSLRACIERAYESLNPDLIWLLYRYPVRRLMITADDLEMIVAVSNDYDEKFTTPRLKYVVFSTFMCETSLLLADTVLTSPDFVSDTMYSMTPKQVFEQLLRACIVSGSITSTRLLTSYYYRLYRQNSSDMLLIDCFSFLAGKELLNKLEIILSLLDNRMIFGSMKWLILETDYLSNNPILVNDLIAKHIKDNPSRKLLRSYLNRATIV